MLKIKIKLVFENTSILGKQDRKPGQDLIVSFGNLFICEMQVGVTYEKRARWLVRSNQKIKRDWVC